MEKKFNVTIGTEAKQIIDNAINAMPLKKRLGTKAYMAFIRYEYSKAGYVNDSIAFYNDVADVIFESDQDPRYAQFVEACMRQVA